MQQLQDSLNSSTSLARGSVTARVVQFKRDTVTVQMNFQSVLNINYDRGVFADGAPVRLDFLPPRQANQRDAHTVYAQIKTVTRLSFDCFHVQFFSETLERVAATQLTTIEEAMVTRSSIEASVASS